MALTIIFTLLSSILSFYFFIMLIVFTASWFRKKLGGDANILPLDRIDAEKLTTMVDEQVELYLAPLMKSKGYSDDDIKEILSIKPIGSGSFRR